MKSERKVLLRKVVFCGDTQVGKTQLISVGCGNKFSDSTSTMGVDFKACTISKEKEDIKLQLWDTAGQERFHSLLSGYIKETQKFVIVCDLTNRKSFDNLPIHFERAKRCSPDAKIIFVGNKVDLKDKQQATEEELKKFAEERDCKCICTSAKENKNINELFAMLAQIENLTLEEKRKKELRTRLDDYIKEIERHKVTDQNSPNMGKIDFAYNFTFFPEPRAHNREVNYRLAQKLLDELNGSKSTKEIFDEKNIQQLREKAGKETTEGKWHHQAATRSVWWSRLFSNVIKFGQNLQKLDKLIEEQEKLQAKSNRPL